MTQDVRFFDDLKTFEEQKRERCWDVRERWRLLQETIAWVDSQQEIPRNSPAGCLAMQRQFAKTT
jgi:hypothetical protein